MCRLIFVKKLILISAFAYCINVLVAQTDNYQSTTSRSNSVQKLEELPELEAFNCRKLMMRVARKTLKEYSKCSRKLKASLGPEEFLKKIQCTVKCTLKEIHMLDELDHITNKSLQVFLDENVPEMYHEGADYIVEPCLDELGGQLNRHDEFCYSYGQFLTCIQETFVEIVEYCSAGR